jgi:hydrogenase-1 operon protein HyaE
MPSPLIEQLIEQRHYAVLNSNNHDTFMQQEGTYALFLTEDPNRYPESNDVAVVLPELVEKFSDKFEPVIVSRELEKQFKERYDIAVWPCLLFIRNGRYLGKINKVRDWSEYMEMIPAILERETQHNPGLGIPVVDESRSQPHA